MIAQSTSSRSMVRLALLSANLLAVLYFLRYIRTDYLEPPHAYVFYATQNSYACSVLINIFNLRHIFFTESRIIVLVTDDISRFYHDAFTNLGATVINKAPPPLHSGSIGYYQGRLLKLFAFELFNLEPRLDRVIVMDSDQLILRDLDPAFDLPLAKVSAPKAYWIDNHTYSSTLLQFRPSSGLWSDVQEAIQHVPTDTYDMDIINAVFQDTIEELPASYSTLNSHWEDRNTPQWFSSTAREASKMSLDENLRELYASVDVLHFTAVGKPWMYDVGTLQAMRPEAHPILSEQWASWRTSALALCPAGFLDHV